jgi:hypothetical protein
MVVVRFLTLVERESKQMITVVVRFLTLVERESKQMIMVVVHQVNLRPRSMANLAQNRSGGQTPASTSSQPASGRASGSSQIPSSTKPRMGPVLGRIRDTLDPNLGPPRQPQMFPGIGSLVLREPLPRLLVRLPLPRLMLRLPVNLLLAAPVAHHVFHPFKLLRSTRATSTLDADMLPMLILRPAPAPAAPYNLPKAGRSSQPRKSPEVITTRAARNQRALGWRAARREVSLPQPESEQIPRSCGCRALSSPRAA